jgi:2-polyprenyl-3-methyl-5-hydroxy-6-metoxy-1,4-benzoquinol methylase
LHYAAFVKDSSQMKFSPTERQQREIVYHAERAKELAPLLSRPVSWDVLQDPARRSWNAYWRMYAYLVTCDLRSKDVMVVGCGFGEDALRLAKLGARVTAFDISADALRVAEKLAIQEGFSIEFNEMPAESLEYCDSRFDYVVARDIMHHVEVAQAMQEIVRVAKPNAVFIASEIYSHTIVDKIRRSVLVESLLYPRMRRFIYGDGDPYITEDERKLNEVDVAEIVGHLHLLEMDHFYFLTNRLIPERMEWFTRADRAVLHLLKPIAPIVAGRVVLIGRIQKQT